MHPSIEHVMQFFGYSHLPGHLQTISRPFCELAKDVVASMKLDGPETVVCLRKLLEAKDAAVRAALSKKG